MIVGINMELSELKAYKFCLIFYGAFPHLYLIGLATLPIIVCTFCGIISMIGVLYCVN